MFSWRFIDHFFLLFSFSTSLSTFIFLGVYTFFSLFFFFWCFHRDLLLFLHILSLLIHPCVGVSLCNFSFEVFMELEFFSPFSLYFPSSPILLFLRVFIIVSFSSVFSSFLFHRSLFLFISIPYSYSSPLSSVSISLVLSLQWRASVCLQ